MKKENRLANDKEAKKIKRSKLKKIADERIEPAQQTTGVPQNQEITYKNILEITGEDIIPDRYYDNKIVLLVRDPYWCFTFWDISKELMEKKKKEIRKEWGKDRLALRINEIQDGNRMRSQEDILITGDADNWYIKINEPGKSYMVEIGFKTEDGHFIMLAASNTVEMPNDHVSDITDEKWMDGGDNFDELFKMSTDGKFTGGSENVLSSARFYMKTEEVNKNKNL